jgi:hypothetical protein
LILVIVQLGAVKIYGAAVEAPKKKEKIGWNSVYHQNWWTSQIMCCFKKKSCLF